MEKLKYWLCQRKNKRRIAHMTKPRILLLDEPHPKARAIMEEVGECVDQENLLEYSEMDGFKCIRCDNFVGIYTQLTPVNNNFTHQYTFKDLKFIATPCTGTDHIQKGNAKIIHLDDDWKANEGREVTSTAEHTWSLILQLAKMKRMQLHNKTIGIIGGLGRIGTCVSDYADAFGMEVIWYDKSGTQIYTLDYLLKESDIITLHIPLQGNEGFIGEKEFAMMKDGELLINTSRQGVVDTDALYKALESDKIGGYADDFVNEVNFSNVFQDKVIQTPHIAGNSLEAREASDLYIAKKIKEYIEGGQ